MNRSIVLVGVGVIVGGLALVASPLVLTGAEMFTIEQEVGIFLTPIGLLVVLIGAVQVNPELTTVGGTFGNPDVSAPRTGPPRPSPAGQSRRGYNPREPVNCRGCGSIIQFDLALCPRCARPRPCRECGRPLGMAENRTDCPSCHREEAFCNCPKLARPTPTTAFGAPSARRS